MGHMDNYVEVKDRIVQFYEKYPEGSLRCKEWKIVEVSGQHYFVYVAQAFRHPEDPAPAEGIAWEITPGTTNFTRTSEAMNAETSAWGRAIVALGISADKGIASANEVRAAQERSKAPDPQQVKTITKASKRKTLADLLIKHFNKDADAIGEFIKEETGKDKTAELSIEEMDKLIKEMAA